MKSAFMISMFICILISCVNGQQAFDVKEARAELYQFYHAYLTGQAEAPSVKKLQIIRDSIIRVHCTKELKKQLDDDTASGQLDWDPFLKAQDYDDEWLKTLQIKEDSEKGSFVVSFLGNYPREWKRIHIKMVLSQHKYLISDVDYFK